MEFLIILGGIAILAATWGILIERQLFSVKRASLKILPAGSPTLTVLHISDLHLAPWQKRKIKFIKSLAELNPDLVVNTGDNLGHEKSIGTAITALGPLLMKPGVFVNGSNDYFAPVLRNPLGYLAKPSERSNGKALDTARLLAAFRQAGWLNLNNREGKLQLNGIKVGFLGVDDAHDDRDDLSSVAGQANNLTDCSIIFGVTHAPYLRVLESFTENSAKLIFAGHTHGGQVCLPIFGALTTNCDLPKKNARGLSAWKFNGRSSVLNVCAGLGHSIYAPVRFFCRPEVRLLSLEAVN